METSVNNKCKAFTSLEQSKKLAKILPLESADMRIGSYVGKSGKVDGTNIHYYTKSESFGAPEIVDAWSLAALLSVLPYPQLSKDKLGVDKEGWMISAFPYGCRYDSIWYNNPVDACVEMVLKLHELNLL